MKQLFEKYSRTCRASLMLLLVYSSHLFSFHSLLANPGQFLTGVISHKKTSSWPKKHTDCILLLSKHELLKQNNDGEGDVSFSGPALVEKTQYHKNFSSLLNNAVQNRSEDSYKLYRLLSTLLI